jgi:hypothetical protein
MTCSATDTTLDPVTSATVTLCLLAAFKSMWLIVSSGSYKGAGDVLGSDTGSDCKLELLCLFKEISSEVSRVERSGDQDLGLSRQLGPCAPKVDSRRGSPSGRLSQIPPYRQ